MNIERRIRKLVNRVDAERVVIEVEYDLDRVFSTYRSEDPRWVARIQWWPKGWRHDREDRTESGYARTLTGAVSELERCVDGRIYRDRSAPDQGGEQ